jgi:hypothetical protein
MRVSTRLLSNAATTYSRLGAAFVVGVFTTWYILGAIGIVGFGLIALATAGTSPSHALDRAIRFGLVRELAAALASGEAGRVRRSFNSALRLCAQAALLLGAITVTLAGLAYGGIFNLPEGLPNLDLALAVLVLGEGTHATIRLLSAPYLQTLFAAQRVGTDNLLILMSRVTHALSAIVVFGWLLPDASLWLQLIGFAASRATLQLTDVAVGVWLARRRWAELRRDRQAFDLDEYRTIRGTVWHSSQVALLMNINVQLLAVMINFFFGVTYNGIWQIAVQLAGFARMFSESLLRGIAPLTTHLQEARRHGTLLDLMQRTIRYQLATVLPMVVFIMLFVHPILDLWVGRRLRVDPRLAAAGLAVPEAIGLAASISIVLLAAFTLRAGFYGVEQILYGLGKIRSYSWFAKWALLIVAGTGALLMGLLGQPVYAPLALVVAYVVYFPGVLLRAAQRQAGLNVGAALKRSLPPPLIAAGLLLVCLAPLRSIWSQLTLAKLLLLVAGAVILYSVIGYFLVLERDERTRLAQLARSGRALLSGGLTSSGTGGDAA